MIIVLVLAVVIVVVVVFKFDTATTRATKRTSKQAYVERKDNLGARSLSNLGSKSLRRHARYASRGV